MVANAHTTLQLMEERVHLSREVEMLQKQV